MEESFRIAARPDGVVVVTIHVRHAAQNTIDGGFIDELTTVLDRLVADPPPAVVFNSGKPRSFVAGADIEAVLTAETAEEVTQISRRVQATFQRIEEAPFVSVAAIDGACLGGGLELALACQARIATPEPHTTIGLPEVQLGLIPGGGGTQRLPRCVGLETALDLLLTGKQLDAKRARQRGLVDDVVPASRLLDAAAELGLELARARAEPPSMADRVSELAEPKHLQDLAVMHNPLGRNLVFGQAEKAVTRKTSGHYPAPLALLRVVRIGLERGVAAGLEAEAEEFGQLAVSDVARRLMALFFAKKALEKDTGVSDVAVQPREVDQVGVLGAGLMGRGVAFVTAQQAGLRVRIKERDDDALTSALRSVADLIREHAEKRKLSAADVERILYRVSASTEDDAFANCQVVIEAVFEDLALKQRLLAAVEEATPPTTVLASNTSSIPVARIAEKSKRKDRIVGMHYFSPVHRMPLLEVVRTPDTSDETVATAVALGQRQGKTVIVVRDGVGFYTSRVLAPYLNEAARMISEGIPIETIDQVARDVGFPVGPVTLLDEVGIDVAARVGAIAEAEYGERLPAPEGFERLVQDGRTGKKSGRGFYLYGGRKKQVDPSVYEFLGVQPDRRTVHNVDRLRDRLVLQMVQEAIRAFDEHVVRSARDADVGAIFGLGFPAYTGGPLRMVDSVGASELVRRMRALEDLFGPRFAPPPRLLTMAREGARFYAD